MFQEIPVSEKNIVAFKVSGRLSDADYRQFLPRLTTLIHKYGPLSVLIELENFRGWDLKAAWDDIRFGKEHDNDFRRIAIVGAKPWQKWMTALGRAFMSAEIHYFDRDHQQDAWKWLRESDEEKAPASDQPAPIPALQPYKHLVAAVDFSPHSEYAVARAVELAGHYGARLSLLHVVEYIAYPYYDYDTLMTDTYDFVDEERQIKQVADERMRKLVDGLDYPHLHHEVLWGEPEHTILTYAEAQNADLVVIGSHGRHGLARLLGSTASTIVKRARRDISVVHLPDA